MANTTKTLNTRIQLRYDTLENWSKSESQSLILLAGEIAITSVPAGDGGIVGQVTKPAILFKVGDGISPFSELPWASGLAADVHAWAKAENKPTYAANEIKDLAAYISGQIKDTDTQYKIVKVDENGYNYKLQSKALDGDWKDVSDSTIVIPNDTEAIKALQDLVGNTAVATQINTAITNLNLANTYDTKGAADQALADAKAYTNTEVAKKVTSVAATDDSIIVSGTATEPTIGVKIDATSGNALKLADGGKGLRVEIPAAAEYSIKKDENSGDYAAVYHLTKGNATVGAAINIPKDMVVKSGSVVTDPAGQAKGTYIKLVLQNDEENPLYINVGDLIEYVTSGSNQDDMVVVTVSEDHKVTATITDGKITKAKLDSEVQASLEKADSALQASNAPGYNDILTKTAASTTYVRQEENKRLMTNEEGTKLAEIAGGAQVNVIETVKVNGTALIPDSAKAVDVTVPTGDLASKDKVAESDLESTLGTKVSGAVQTVTAGTGLKATKTGTDVAVSIDDAVTFILYGGTASDLV